MRALVLAPFSDSALKELGTICSVRHESWTETNNIYDPEELGQRLSREDICVLVVEADFLFEELFQQAKPLKFVGLCRNSLHHVDIDAATEHGVVVVNTPSRNAQSVAEHTLGLMLSLAKGIPSAHTYVKAGQWQQPTEPYVNMRGIELEGKVAGIIGLGFIGRKVAGLCAAFGMKVLGLDPYVDASKLSVEMVSLDDLLRRADFVTLHAAPTEETQNMLNERSLGLLKPTAYVINTADASIIDYNALASCLDQRRIAGAALDVFETHPIAPNSPLLKLNNVVLTPHIGGATDGTIERQSRMILDDLKRFLKSEKPLHLANPKVWGKHGR